MPYLDSFDSRQLRNVLGTFTTGVTIVTTRSKSGIDYGVTANSFSSVSLDPPLVLWSQALTSRSFQAFCDSDHFAVNILADDQVAMSNHFATSKNDKFAQLEFTRGLGEVAVLPGTTAHFECVKVASYPAGDHMIFLGRVERVGHSGRRPLAFAHGRYMVSYAHDLGPFSLHEATAPAAGCEAVATGINSLSIISEALSDLTVSLAVWGNHGPTIVSWHRGAAASRSRLRPGLVMSTTQTAAGRGFVAFLPENFTKAFVDEDLRLFRIADEDEQEQRKTFNQIVEESRECGFARAVDSQPTLAASFGRTVFSAPVYDAEEKMIFALSVAASDFQSPDDVRGLLPQALLQTAKRLSEHIAAHAPSDVE